MSITDARSAKVFIVEKIKNLSFRNFETSDNSVINEICVCKRRNGVSLADFKTLSLIVAFCVNYSADFSGVDNIAFWGLIIKIITFILFRLV